MKELVRCKACGYIMEKSALGEFCPACGVKAQMFEPYEDKVTGVRRLLLDLDIHPIVVHFPETLGGLLILMALVFPLLPVGAQHWLWSSLQLLSWLFPIAVLAGFLSGIFDGKVRYRKVTTPILRRKMAIGILYLLSSLAQAILAFSQNGLQDMGLWLGYLGAAVISLACGTILGKIGVTLLHGAMPGDKIFLGKKKKPKAS